MVSCTVGGVTTSFEYGADGLRRSMTVTEGENSTTTDYLLDGQNVVQELVEGSAVATYLAGPRGVEYRQDDVPETPTRSWYLYDGLGSVLAEIDEGDNATGHPIVTATRAYDVYGAPRPDTVTGSTDSKHEFCGGLGHTADDTGLTYMRARYYDPELGRFVSEDPGRNGANWYAYCDDNPVNSLDPDGKLTLRQVEYRLGDYWSVVRSSDQPDV